MISDEGRKKTTEAISEALGAYHELDWTFQKYGYPPEEAQDDYRAEIDSILFDFARIVEIQNGTKFEPTTTDENYEAWYVSSIVEAAKRIESSCDEIEDLLPKKPIRD